MVLNSPLQLVKLFRSVNAACNLANTHVLTVKQYIIADFRKWESISKKLEPAEYLMRILQMTRSLRVLNIEPVDDMQIFPLKSTWDMEDSFVSELRKQTLNPSFLPVLCRLQSPLIKSILPLFNGRPLEYAAAQALPRDYTTTNTTGCYHPVEISAARFSYKFSASVFCDDISWAADSIKSNLEVLVRTSLTVKHLKIIVVSIWSKFESLDQSISTWVNMISPTQVVNQLESLYLAFEPLLVHNPLNEQQGALRVAVALMPNLAYAVLGAPGLEWRRLIGEESNPTSGLPDWTPCPNCPSPEVLSWWLDTLGIDPATGARSEGLGHVASRMWSSMRTRWDDKFVPSVDTLRNRLSNLAAD
ncbi:hypothetical protein FRC07_008494 [Ceratobasidium sp. 392]|nr:hypothetical protein FRC07_008494 [Ceratobasidium sp. 392]